MPRDSKVPLCITKIQVHEEGGFRCIMARARHIEIPTCIPPITLVRTFRETITNENWDYQRVEGSKMVHRWAIIMPLVNAAKTLGIKVISGPYKGVEMITWSHVEGSSGAIHYISCMIPNSITDSDMKSLAEHWISKLDREPWKWTFRERSMLGYLLPTYKKSRKGFALIGLSTGKNDWPIEITTKLPYNGDFVEEQE